MNLNVINLPDPHCKFKLVSKIKGFTGCGDNILLSNQCSMLKNTNIPYCTSSNEFLWHITLNLNANAKLISKVHKISFATTLYSGLKWQNRDIAAYDCYFVCLATRFFPMTFKISM